MTWTDEELVARSMGGDSDSFNELVLRWERPIYALAYRTIGREEDARDVCQETFLRAFRALPGFRGQAKFSSWLYRIALNLCRDWVRRERRTPVVQPPEDVDLMDLAAAAEPAESSGDLIARQGARTRLARWAPPEPRCASNKSQVASHKPRSRWREIPVWAQVAAALLFLGVAARIANLDVRYDNAGLSIRTGSSSKNVTAVPIATAMTPPGTASQMNVVATREELNALERRLKTEFRATPVSSMTA